MNALIKRAHDVLAAAEADEERADDRGHHAGPADGQRHHHARKLEFGRQSDGGEHHGGDRGDDVGFEQVGGHARAVADIITDIVGDRGGVARIVLGDTCLHLAHHVAADIGALGEDAAAETGENRDQRGAEGGRDERVDHLAARRIEAERAGEEPEIDRNAEQPEAGDKQPGHRAGLEGEVEPASQRLGRRLRDADIGAHGHVHADEAGGGG